MITRSCSDISNDSKTQYHLFINTRSQENYANDPGVRHYEWSPDRKRTDNQTIKLLTWYNLLMADFPPTILCLLFYWGSQLVVISHPCPNCYCYTWPAVKEERETGRGDDGYAIKEEGCSLVLNEAYLALRTVSCRVYRVIFVKWSFTDKMFQHVHVKSRMFVVFCISQILVIINWFFLLHWDTEN